MDLEDKIFSFWEWFQKHNHFSQIPEDEETYFFTELKYKLEKVDEHLTYEISPLKQGVQKMIISSDNSQDICVTKLIKSAPKLRGWSFTLLNN